MSDHPSLPRAVLFDWDNTLVDTWPCIHGALNATFRAMGHPEWSFEEFRARLGPSMRDSFPQTFGDRWEEARDVFYASFAATHIGMLRVLPGAGEMLKALHDSGLYMGVVSNKIGEHLRAEAEHLGWSRYFGRIVGALDAARDKPAPEPVAMALAGSGIDPGPHVWFVGDSDIDMETASNAGCFRVLVRTAPPDGGEFQGHPPQRHFPDCGSFAAAMRELSIPISHF
ncbi:MAG: HAD family hydrolase [Alphaproteobacteria bacterium]